MDRPAKQLCSHPDRPAAGTWEGKTHFCVAPDKRFRSVGRSGCTKRGFDRRGFFEVDTGKKPDWTQTLSN